MSKVEAVEPIVCAEYVLGVLPSEERLAIEEKLSTSPEASACVDSWAEILVHLTEDVSCVPPPPFVWARIKDELCLENEQIHPIIGKSGSFRLIWRWLSFSAGGVTASIFLTMFLMSYFHRSFPDSSQGFSVASLQQKNGSTVFTAQVNFHQHVLIIATKKQPQLYVGHSQELWLLSPGEKPLAIGLIGDKRETTLLLSDNLLKHFAPSSSLAVSMEPSNGSPTGEPTGPIVASGAVLAFPLSPS